LGHKNKEIIIALWRAW